MSYILVPPKEFGLNLPGFKGFKGMADNSHPLIPAKSQEYQFQKDLLVPFRAFLEQPHGDALWITGPTGCGKTSFVLEYAARVNWPVSQITCHSTMEFSELRGQFVVQSVNGGHPEMTFKYGPLATAMKEGHILLINEIDLMDPGELAGLNDVLEGRPLIIAENSGEVIKPHPDFRVIVTANSCGSGDMTGLYQGIQSQNIAAMDRYRVMKVGYPTPSVEKKLLAKVAPDILDTLREKMVQLANEIRSAFEGKNGNPGTLSVTMSPRTLVRWARLTRDFKGAKNPMAYALDLALLNRCSFDERTAILDLIRPVFGDEWGKKPEKQPNEPAKA